VRLFLNENNSRGFFLNLKVLWTWNTWTWTKTISVDRFHQVSEIAQILHTLIYQGTFLKGSYHHSWEALWILWCWIFLTTTWKVYCLFRCQIV
jgi:hypothetical protein